MLYEILPQNKTNKSKENKFLRLRNNTCVQCLCHCRLFPSRPGSPPTPASPLKIPQAYHYQRLPLYHAVHHWGTSPWTLSPGLCNTVTLFIVPWIRQSTQCKLVVEDCPIVIYRKIQFAIHLREKGKRFVISRKKKMQKTSKPRKRFFTSLKAGNYWWKQQRYFSLVRLAEIRKW